MLTDLYKFVLSYFDIEIKKNHEKNVFKKTDGYKNTNSSSIIIYKN